MESARHLDRLTAAYLPDAGIGTVGAPGEVRAEAPRLEILDLQGNLLQSWESLLDIVREMPRLRILNFGRALGPGREKTYRPLARNPGHALKPCPRSAAATAAAGRPRRWRHLRSRDCGRSFCPAAPSRGRRCAQPPLVTRPRTAHLSLCRTCAHHTQQAPKPATAALRPAAGELPAPFSRPGGAPRLLLRHRHPAGRGGLRPV